MLLAVIAQPPTHEPRGVFSRPSASPMSPTLCGVGQSPVTAHTHIPQRHPTPAECLRTEANHYYSNITTGTRATIDIALSGPKHS